MPDPAGTSTENPQIMTFTSQKIRRRMMERFDAEHFKPQDSYSFSEFTGTIHKAIWSTSSSEEDVEFHHVDGEQIPKIMTMGYFPVVIEEDERAAWGTYELTTLAVAGHCPGLLSDDDKSEMIKDLASTIGAEITQKMYALGRKGRAPVYLSDPQFRWLPTKTEFGYERVHQCFVYISFVPKIRLKEPNSHSASTAGHVPKI